MTNQTSVDRKFWLGDYVIFSGSFGIKHAACITKEDNKYPTIIKSDGDTQCVDINKLEKSNILFEGATSKGIFK